MHRHSSGQSLLQSCAATEVACACSRAPARVVHVPFEGAAMPVTRLLAGLASHVATGWPDLFGADLVVPVTHCIIHCHMSWAAVNLNPITNVDANC